MLQFRQIQALHAVVDSGTVVKAAERLGISQPGVSNLIAALEHHVGFELFQRISGRLHPTPEALELFNSIEGVIEGFEHVDRRARALRKRERGRLVVGGLPELSLEYIPAMLREFLAGYPDVQLSFQTRSSIKVQEMVSDHSIEVGIAEGPIDHDNIAGEMLSYNCFCAMPRDHPLTGKKIITPQDLSGESFISLGSYHMTYHRMRAVFAANNCQWNDRCQARTFYAALALVREGLGVALIDPFTIVARAMPEVVIKPFKVPVAVDLAIIWAKDRPISVIGKSFIKFARERMALTSRQFNASITPLMSEAGQSRVS